MNRRYALKTMLLGAASVTVGLGALPKLPTQVDRQWDEHFGEVDPFLRFVRQEVCDVPHALVVGKPKSGKTALTRLLAQHVYPQGIHRYNADILSPGLQDCSVFQSKTDRKPRFVECSINKRALFGVAYGADVIEFLPCRSDICAADVAFLTFVTNEGRFVACIKNRHGAQDGVWQIG